MAGSDVYAAAFRQRRRRRPQQLLKCYKCLVEFGLLQQLQRSLIMLKRSGVVLHSPVVPGTSTC